MLQALTLELSRNFNCTGRVNFLMRTFSFELFFFFFYKLLYYQASCKAFIPTVICFCIRVPLYLPEQSMRCQNSISCCFILIFVGLKGLNLKFVFNLSCYYYLEFLWFAKAQRFKMYWFVLKIKNRCRDWKKGKSIRISFPILAVYVIFFF